VNTSSNSFNIIVRQELTINAIIIRRALNEMFVVILFSFFFFLIF